MSSTSIFTKRQMGLDKKVWLVFLFVCLCCIGLLSYGLVANEPCHPIQLTVKNAVRSSNEFYEDDALQFTAVMSGSKVISWDFGDNSSKDATGPSVTHAYATPGDYVVTAKVNERCNEALTVKVIRTLPPVQEQTTENPVYVGDAIIPSNRFPQVGERVSFTSNIDAGSYKWTIEGNATSEKKEKMATYIFDQPQLYTVNLTLDNDPKKTFSIPVMVAPLPKQKEPTPTNNIPRILVPPPSNSSTANNSTPEPSGPPTEKPTTAAPKPSTDQNAPPRKFLYKSTAQFKDMLEEVISGDKNVRDFDIYLCEGGNTLVIENGNQTTFAGLCRILAGEKKRIVSVEFLDYQTFSDKSRCVKELKVKHEKKGGLFNKGH